MDSIAWNAAFDESQHQYDPDVDMQGMVNVEGYPDIEMTDVQHSYKRPGQIRKPSLQQLASLAVNTSLRIARAVRHHRCSIRAETKIIRVLDRTFTGDFLAPSSSRSLITSTKQIESVILFLSRLAAAANRSNRFCSWLKIHRQGFLRLKSKSYKCLSLAGNRRTRSTDMEEQGTRDNLEHIFSRACSQHVWELNPSSPYKRRQKKHQCSSPERRRSHDPIGSQGTTATALETIAPETQPKLHDHRQSILKPPKWLKEQEQYDGTKVLQGKMSTDFQMRKSKWAPLCFQLTRSSTMEAIYKALHKTDSNGTHANKSSLLSHSPTHENPISIHELAALVSTMSLEDNCNRSMRKPGNSDDSNLSDPKNITTPLSQTQVILHPSNGMTSSNHATLSAKANLLSPQTQTSFTADLDQRDIVPIASSNQNHAITIDEQSKSSPPAHSSSTTDVEMSQFPVLTTDESSFTISPPSHTHETLCDTRTIAYEGSSGNHAATAMSTSHSHVDRISVEAKQSPTLQSGSEPHQLNITHNKSRSIEQSSLPKVVYTNPLEPPPHARLSAPVRLSVLPATNPQLFQQSSMVEKVHNYQTNAQNSPQNPGTLHKAALAILSSISKVAPPATANASVAFVLAQPSEPVKTNASVTRQAPPEKSSAYHSKAVPRPASAAAPISFNMAVDTRIVATGPPDATPVHPVSSALMNDRALMTPVSGIAPIPFTLSSVQFAHSALKPTPTCVPSAATTCSNEPVLSTTSPSAPPPPCPTSNVPSAGGRIDGPPSNRFPEDITMRSGAKNETKSSDETWTSSLTPDHHDSGYWSRATSPKDNISSASSPYGPDEAMEVSAPADLAVDAEMVENTNDDNLSSASTIHENFLQPNDTNQYMTINQTEMIQTSVNPMPIHEPASIISYGGSVDVPQSQDLLLAETGFTRGTACNVATTWTGEVQDGTMDFTLQPWAQGSPLISGSDGQLSETNHEATSSAASSSVSVSAHSSGKRKLNATCDNAENEISIASASHKRSKLGESSDESIMQGPEDSDSIHAVDFLPKTWNRSSNESHPRVIQRKPKPLRVPFHVASIISAGQDDEIGGPYWRQLRCLRNAFSKFIFWDEGVADWFVQLINQCKWLDAKLAAYKPRWQVEEGEIPVTVDTLNELADYEPGVIVSECIPDILDSRPENSSDFHADLEMLLQFKPHVWKQLISAILQMDISLVVLLGGPNHIREHDSLRIMQPESYIYNLRMIDDLDAQRSNYWNVYDEFLDWTQLEGTDSEDFHALLSMILKGGYFGELSVFLTNWLKEDEEHRAQFEGIIEQSGFVRWDDEDGYLAIYQKIGDYLETKVTFESHKAREGAKTLLNRCIEWRYPRWHQRIWPEEREDDFLDWLDQQEETDLEDV